MMRNKSDVAFVLAVIFTLLALAFVITCVEGVVWSKELQKAGDDNKNIENVKVEGFFAELVCSIGLTLSVVYLFVWSFGGVIASEMNYNCVEDKVRRASRIMLGINGTFMAASVVFFFCSLLYA